MAGCKPLRACSPIILVEVDARGFTVEGAYEAAIDLLLELDADAAVLVIDCHAALARGTARGQRSGEAQVAAQWLKTAKHERDGKLQAWGGHCAECGPSFRSPSGWRCGRGGEYRHSST